MNHDEWTSAPFPQFTDAQVAEVTKQSPVAEVIAEYTPFAEKPDGSFAGTCPFCRSESLTADPESGRWMCLHCLEAGSVVVFISKVLELWWPDAVKFLADRAGLTFPDEAGA